MEEEEGAEETEENDQISRPQIKRQQRLFPYENNSVALRSDRVLTTFAVELVHITLGTAAVLDTLCTFDLTVINLFFGPQPTSRTSEHSGGVGLFHLFSP